MTARVPIRLWTPPTTDRGVSRRRIMQMFAAAVTAAAVGGDLARRGERRSRDPVRTRWIGHC